MTIPARTKTFQRAGLVFILAIAFFVSGCRTVSTRTAKDHFPTGVIPSSTTTNSAPKIVVHIPKSHPTTCQKLNPIFWFGNMDDPVAPDWYRPTNRMRNALWKLRNPLHNFFFYVVGIADKEFEIIGRYPGKIGNPNGGWNWTVCRYKWLRLPLISYTRGDFDFYLGWRNRGNLGMKVNF